jgi:hypothetical protein
MTFNNDNRPKLTAIKTPGDYVVKVCRIRDEDISTTQKGDAKIKVLMTTKDSQKINDTFFASTDGALKRAAAFVGTATGDKVGLPVRSAEGLKSFLAKAEGKWLKVTVVQEDVTFADGITKTICKVTKFHPFTQQVDTNEAPEF